MSTMAYGPLLVVGGTLSATALRGVEGGSEMDHDGLLAAFDAHQRARGLSPKTIRRRYSSLHRFARFIQPVDLLAATPDLIEDWLNDQGAPETKAAYLGDLRALYRWATRRRMCGDDPTELVDRIRRPKGLPRPILPEELALALAGADDRLRVVLLAGALEGLRRFEIAPLAAEDCNERHLVVRGGKGARDRVQPMHPLMWAALRVYDVRHGWLFPSPCGPAHVTDQTIARWVTGHFGALGIERTTHSLRHAFGSQLAEISQGNLLAVRDLLGHASVSTSERYLAFDQSGLAGLVNQLKAG